MVKKYGREKKEKTLSTAHLKKCKSCGQNSELSISRCPNCKSPDFEEITDLGQAYNNGTIRAYFNRWPDWPNKYAWHPVIEKAALENH